MTITLLFASILILFLLFILLFIFRERVNIKIEKDVLILHYPLSTKRIALSEELENWEVQEAYYLRLGKFYSIRMLFRNGKQVNVSSRLNEENFDLLYHHLIASHSQRQVGNKYLSK